jgi:hypothetical protein
MRYEGKGSVRWDLRFMASLIPLDGLQPKGYEHVKNCHKMIDDDRLVHRLIPLSTDLLAPSAN